MVGFGRPLTHEAVNNHDNTYGNGRERKRKRYTKKKKKHVHTFSFSENTFSFIRPEGLTFRGLTATCTSIAVRRPDSDVKFDLN